MDSEFKKYCKDNSISGAQLLLYKTAYKLFGIDGCMALRISLGDKTIIDDEVKKRRLKILSEMKNMSDIHPIPAIRERRRKQLGIMLGSGKEREGD